MKRKHGVKMKNGVCAKPEFIALLIVCMLIVTACTSNDGSNTEQSKPSQPGIQQDDQESIRKGDNIPDGELLFEDSRISIYSNDDKGYSVTILYGEYAYQFEGFNSLRPHCTTWEADADGDGAGELYLIHTVGSGTGVSEGALFVFEPNGETLEMYCHDSSEIQEEFNASCSGVYLPEQQTLQLSYGGNYHTVRLDDEMYWQYLPTATRTVLINGQQIHYSPAGNNMVQLSFHLSFESEEVFSLQSYLPENTMISCLIRFNGMGFEVVEGLNFVYESEYPWIAPIIEAIDYEEFFAMERSYHDLDAAWYGFTRAQGSMWFVDHGDFGTAYELRSDENGFYICECSKGKNTLHRVPGTKDLDGCTKAITNTWKLYCVKGGQLLCVDVLNGKRDILYTAEQIPDLMLCHNDVLYFLAISDGVLSLNRLYVPTMTLEQLYTQTASEVPANCYDLCWINTNHSVIEWETINPAFWQAITMILNSPKWDYSELAYPDAFDLDYIAEHPLQDESVQHNFSTLQKKLNLRPRMKCCYDPVSCAYTERYGIYDICFFGTGIHNDDEHFEDYPAYDSGESRTPLTAEELTYFAEYTKSFADEGITEISCFFTSFYTDPRDMNATEFLRYCPDEYTLTWGDEDEFRLVIERSDQWGEEEITLEEMPVPCHRYSRTYLNEILMRYAGITVEDMHTNWLEELLYLPETDCFYTFTSDCGPGTFIPAYGEREGDIIKLWGCGSGTDYSVLTLQKVGSDWQIICHQENTK